MVSFSHSVLAFTVFNGNSQMKKATMQGPDFDEEELCEEVDGDDDIPISRCWKGFKQSALIPISRRFLSDYLTDIH